MSWDLGDVVPLSITIKDADGQLANAGAVHVTITTPDGVAATAGPVGPTSTGVYDHDYETVQAGRHLVRWVATGANASAFTDAFDVEPADDGDFVSLADVKEHLKKTGTTEDDEALRWFISAACRTITDRMGAVSPVTMVSDCSARRGVVVLPTRPVVAVTSVVKLPGGDPLPAADALAGTSGWALENTEGVLSMPPHGQVRVTYRAGRSPLPPNFRLAALDLIKHLWQGSQHNNAGGRPMLGDSDAIAAGLGRSYAMPYRVMELLGLKKTQERDEPLVG
ncbi:hypothetical protein [Nonomuraea sp. NPDC023979]|uniref:hypothetical protein n=1 Tax=Nonomuraea sp. NPDC023979 TaxID=3154796 RepID=UPI0033F523D3